MARETGIAMIKAGEETCEVTPKPAVSSPRAANRGSLPKHLPRVEEVIEPEASLCDCGGGLHQIGEVEEDRKTVWGTGFPTTVGTAGPASGKLSPGLFADPRRSRPGSGSLSPAARSMPVALVRMASLRPQHLHI